MTLSTFDSPVRFCVIRGLLLAGLWLAASAGAAPQITGASLSPNPVNVTTGTQFATINVAAKDAAGVDEILVSFTSPSGHPLPPVILRASSLLEGNVSEGRWQRMIEVPGFATPETQTVSWSVMNLSGQTVRYDAEVAPLPAGIQGDLMVQNTGTVDAVGPVITAISTTPSSVNVTSGTQNVRIDVTLQDAVAGLASASVFLYPPTSSFSIDNDSLYYAFFPPFEIIPVLTTATLTLPRFVVPGNYRWVVTATDGANQVSEYGGPNGLPFPGGFSGLLTVQNDGTVDTSPPTLVSLVVNPPTRLVASLPSNVTFTVKATDEGGVETAYALLASPYGLNHDLFPMTRSSGTALNGTWTGSVAVSAAYPAGTYPVGVLLADVTGKTVTYGISSFYAALPAGSTQNIIVSNGPLNAYTTWRYARPALTGPSGLPGTDYDGDGLPNAVEFLCGTDPLLPSQAGGGDPNSGRAPVYSLTPTHFRAEYRLSAPKAALGSGNALTLQPSTALNPAGPWSNVTPSVVSGDLHRAEIPLSNGERQFLRFLVLP